MINHPHDRAERLRLKKKYSLKHTRLKGLSDGKDYSGRIDETPSEADGSLRDEAAQP